MVLLGSRIKELRHKKKFTQAELAAKVGVTKSTIAAYENDSRQPSYDVLIKLVTVFKVSIDSLLLNRPGHVLEVYDLSMEQLEILEVLIAHFRKTNYMEDFFTKFSPDFEKKIKDYLDTKIEDKENPE